MGIWGDKAVSLNWKYLLSSVIQGEPLPMSPPLSNLHPLFFISPSIVSFLWLPSTMTNSTLRHNTFCQPASSSSHVPANHGWFIFPLLSPGLSTSHPFWFPDFYTPSLSGPIHLHLCPLYPASHHLLSPLHNLFALPFICDILPTLHPSSLPLPSYPTFRHLSSCSLHNKWAPFPLILTFLEFFPKTCDHLSPIRRIPLSTTLISLFTLLFPYICKFAEFFVNNKQHNISLWCSLKSSRIEGRVVVKL